MTAEGFVEMLVNQLTARGVMEAAALYQPPFTNLHAGGPDALFADQEKIIEGLFTTLQLFHQGLDAEAA